jgi:hypothetical protein
VKWRKESIDVGVEGPHFADDVEDEVGLVRWERGEGLRTFGVLGL